MSSNRPSTNSWIRGRRLLQARPGLPRCLGCASREHDRLAHRGFHDFGEEVFLRREVVVEQALADAGFGRDVAGPRCRQPVAGEDPPRSGQDGVTSRVSDLLGSDGSPRRHQFSYWLIN